MSCGQGEMRLDLCLLDSRGIIWITNFFIVCNITL